MKLGSIEEYFSYLFLESVSIQLLDMKYLAVKGWYPLTQIHIELLSMVDPSWCRLLEVSHHCCIRGMKLLDSLLYHLRS